jgi:hypothetical protein
MLFLQWDAVPKLTLRGVLETKVGDGTEELGLEQKVAVG